MSFKDIVENIVNFLNFSVIPLLFALALLFFLYGVVQYFFIKRETTGEGRKNALNIMIYGIIGLVVMTSMWGLVTIILNTFGI